MPVRPIVITGEPVLHHRAEPVTGFGPDLQALIDDMFATQTASNGWGWPRHRSVWGCIFTWHLANEDGIPRSV